MPNNGSSNTSSPCPKLVVMDLLGTLVEHDGAVRGALAAAFQAHGEKVDLDVASMAIGYPGLHGISRILKWLHPSEEPHLGSVRSIHDLAVKELSRMVSFAGGIQPAEGVERLCRTWANLGVAVAATTTLHASIVKPLLTRVKWDQNPPFSALVLAEEVERPTPGPDLILECMRRTGVSDLAGVAKVASHGIGLADAKQLGCGWSVLVDDGSLTTDQIAALAPTAIVDQAVDLMHVWKFPASSDTALEDEIARILHRSSRNGVA